MNLNLAIRQGETFSQVVRWETDPPIFKAITGITAAAPAVITCPLHGIPDGWRAKVVSVKGMTAINDNTFRQVSVIDANTISIPTLNTADMRAYQSGGYLNFNTPVDLTGYAARMSIKDKVGGTELLRLDSTGSAVGLITISPGTGVITLSITAVNTLALAWLKGFYDLDLISPSGVVTTLLSGTVTVTPAVTTT